MEFKETPLLRMFPRPGCLNAKRRAELIQGGQLDPRQGKEQKVSFEFEYAVNPYWTVDFSLQTQNAFCALLSLFIIPRFIVSMHQRNFYGSKAF